MAVSYRGFQIELYEEYLFDGGFVSEQRRTLLANPVGEWRLLRDWEDRIEAYVDGLTVGGNLALDVCKRRAAEGEPSELEIAVRAFCRAERFDLIEAAAETDDVKKVQAICNGLLHERHAGVQPLVHRLLEHPVLFPAMTKVAGYQRLPIAELLIRRGAGCPEVAWALGRIRDPKGLPFLLDALNDPVTAGPAALAIARITQTVPRQADLTLVGLVGEQDRLDQLHADSSAGSSLALGLLGFPVSIPSLVNRLPQPEAAVALQLITGAGLIEQKPVESEELEDGERPTLVSQLQTEPDAWETWWASNSKNLSSAQPLRRGQPYSAGELLRQLQEPQCLHLERYWATEQLACRHAMALSFEHDMLYTEQSRQLS